MTYEEKIEGWKEAKRSLRNYNLALVPQKILLKLAAKAYWGTFGKQGRAQFKYKKVTDLSVTHLRKILISEHIQSFQRAVFLAVMIDKLNKKMKGQG